MPVSVSASNVSRSSVFGKISIFLTFSGSFAVKNDNIHFFFAVLVAMFEFAGFAPKQKYTAWHGNGPYYKIPTEKEPNRAHGFA